MSLVLAMTFSLVACGEEGASSKVDDDKTTQSAEKEENQSEVEEEQSPANNLPDIQDVVTDDTFAYGSYGDGTCVIEALNEDISGDIVIPSNSPSGDKVITIGDDAFDYCENLTSITISDGVKTIGENAFFSNYDLANVTIPDSVTSIGKGAFDCCDDNISVTYKGNTYTEDTMNDLYALFGN